MYLFISDAPPLASSFVCQQKDCGIQFRAQSAFIVQLNCFALCVSLAS